MNKGATRYSRNNYQNKQTNSSINGVGFVKDSRGEICVLEG